MTHEKFKKNNLRVHALEKAHVFEWRIFQLRPATNKMLLELYFEKWGGPVEEVITIPSDQAAFITFKEVEGKYTYN